MSYRDVAAKTGASTTTVTRVAKFIENGEGGYRKILNARIGTTEPFTPHSKKWKDLMARKHQRNQIQNREQSSDAVFVKYLGKKD